MFLIIIKSTEMQQSEYLYLKSFVVLISLYISGDMNRRMDGQIHRFVFKVIFRERASGLKLITDSFFITVC